jgi:carotenoid cleavage dioxygenase-like enzyme
MCSFWSASADGKAPFFNGVSHFSMAEGRHRSFFFGDSTHCGEPLPTDDGKYILVELHDGARQRSGLAVLHAKHVQDGPLAIAWHPFPIGMSFHGVFVPQLYGEHRSEGRSR